MNKNKLTDNVCKWPSNTPLQKIPKRILSDDQVRHAESAIAFMRSLLSKAKNK